MGTTSAQTYVDNVSLLLALDADSLHAMLNICSAYAKEVAVKFSVNMTTIRKTKNPIFTRWLGK